MAHISLHRLLSGRSGHAALGEVLLLASAVALYGQSGPDETLLVSAREDGVRANLGSIAPSLSADGRYVAFESLAFNLVPDDVNEYADIFVKDMATGNVTLASVRADGAQGNHQSNRASISGNGRYVAFDSHAWNFAEGDEDISRPDVFVKDMVTGELHCASTSSTGRRGNGDSVWPSISGDGTRIAFLGYANDLVSGDTNDAVDVFVKDMTSGKVEWASTSSNGTPANGSSSEPTISADGRWVVFRSSASNLVNSDTNGLSDIFVKDLETGQIRLVSVAMDGTQANGLSGTITSVSANGRIIAFSSLATNLVPGVTQNRNIFIKDMETGEVHLGSSSADGTKANADSFGGSLSSNGRFVAFRSRATNLTANPTNGLANSFVKDLESGTVRLMSVTPSGTGGNSDCAYSRISPDSSFVTFDSEASDFVPNDVAGHWDVFLHATGFSSQVATTLTLPAPNLYVGKSSVLSATLRDKASLAPIAGESVRFLFDGTTIGTVTTDSLGKAKFSWIVPEGTAVASHRLQARFLGDDTYKASFVGKDVAVQKGPVKVQVASKSAAAGGMTTMQAKLVNASGSPLVGRTLSFRIDGVLAGTGITNTYGTATKKITVPAAPGSYTIAVEFAGDETHTDGSGTGTLSVG